MSVSVLLCAIRWMVAMERVVWELTTCRTSDAIREVVVKERCHCRAHG